MFFPESGSAKNLDPIWNIRIHEKKRPKTVNTVLFGQAPPKPNQKHLLEPTSLLMDRSGSAKKPGSIRIRNTVKKNVQYCNTCTCSRIYEISHWRSSGNCAFLVIGRSLVCSFPWEIVNGLGNLYTFNTTSNLIPPYPKPDLT